MYVGLHGCSWFVLIEYFYCCIENFQIQRRYEAATGYLPYIFEGSSPGAGMFGYLKIRRRLTPQAPWIQRVEGKIFSHRDVISVIGISSNLYRGLYLPCLYSIKRNISYKRKIKWNIFYIWFWSQSTFRISVANVWRGFSLRCA